MSLEPLLQAHWVIQVHAFGAMAAFVLGLYQLAAPKGDFPHRLVGVIWVLLMAIISVSSIFVLPAMRPGLPFLQWFTPIHIFTVITLFGVVSGAYILLRGGAGLKNHKNPFIGIFIGGLIIAGAFAFLPGRIMHAVVFGG